LRIALTSSPGGGGAAAAAAAAAAAVLQLAQAAGEDFTAYTAQQAEMRFESPRPALELPPASALHCAAHSGRTAASQVDVNDLSLF
jgi:hypothetical protein